MLRREPKFWVVALLCLATIVGLSSSTAAQSSDAERATELFRKARALHEAGKLAEARPLYLDAFGLAKSQDVAANLGIAELGLGMHRDAAEHLGFALDHLLPSTKPEQIKALKDAFGKAEKKVGTLHIGALPADATITLDEKDLGKASEIGRAFVEPGEHVITGKKSGFETASKKVTIAEGEKQDVTLELVAVSSPELPGPATPPGQGNGGPADGGGPKPSHERSLVPVYIVGGVALVGLVGTIFFEVKRSGHSSDAEDAAALVDAKGCGTGTTTPGPCSDLHDANTDEKSAKNLRNVSIGALVAGVAAGAVYLLLTPSEKTTSRHRTRKRARAVDWDVVPVASGTERGLWLQGSFF